MSYSTADFANAVIATMRSAGYALHAGDGIGCGDPAAFVPDSKPSDAEGFDPEINGFWFTWAGPRTDVEVGPTRDNARAAWADAIQHLADRAIADEA